MSDAPKPGIYPGMSWKEYRGLSAVNNSFLKVLRSRSPRHAKWERDHPSEPTPALLFGQALHGMILEPTTWEERFAVKPICGRRTKEGKEIYEAFLCHKGDRQEVSSEDYAKIQAVRDAVLAQQCRELVCSGRAEVSIVWEDKETGVLCKGRLDYERTSGWNHCVTDVKSTEDASPTGMFAAVNKYQYHQAAAFYVDGWKVLTGEDSLFIWLAVEKSAPFVTKPYECPDEMLDVGRRQYREALRLYAECLEKDQWPAYGDDVELLEAPEWWLRLHGVGPDMIRPIEKMDAKYTVGPEPEVEDEFDEFMK